MMGWKKESGRNEESTEKREKGSSRVHTEFGIGERYSNNRFVSSSFSRLSSFHTLVFLAHVMRFLTSVHCDYSNSFFRSKRETPHSFSWFTWNSLVGMATDHVIGKRRVRVLTPRTHRMHHGVYFNTVITYLKHLHHLETMGDQLSIVIIRYSSWLLHLLDTVVKLKRELLSPWRTMYTVRYFYCYEMKTEN